MGEWVLNACSNWVLNACSNHVDRTGRLPLLVLPPLLIRVVAAWVWRALRLLWTTSWQLNQRLLQVGVFINLCMVIFVASLLLHIVIHCQGC